MCGDGPDLPRDGALEIDAGVVDDVEVVDVQQVNEHSTDMDRADEEE